MGIHVQELEQPSFWLDALMNLGPPLVLITFALLTILLVYLAFRFKCKPNAGGKPKNR